MQIENLLNKLQGVKSTSRNRWLCKCPAHEDKSPSMHIKLDDNGKILINCKAGCGVYDIVASIGMHISDLMPESPTHHRQKPHKQVMYASEALELIRYESQIVIACGYAIRKGTLTQNDLERAEKSMQTINRCLELTR